MTNLFAPPSQLPYRNRLVYLIQTKLQAELSPDILHDIDHALYDYAKFCDKVKKAELAQEAEQNERVMRIDSATKAESKRGEFGIL